MNMYYCNNCEEIFDVADYKEEKGERINICPECGSEDFTDAGTCEMCSEPISPNEELCEDCRNYLQTEFEKMAYDRNISYMNLLNGIEEFINE